MKKLEGLTTMALGRYWEHYLVLPSTNTYCKEQIARLPHGAIITAACQTQGKGRQGHVWQEHPGKGLALSILLKHAHMSIATALPLVVGLSVAEALQTLCGVSCKLKWSNDILVEQKKIGGILCESRIFGNQCSIIVGIGVNLQQTQDDFDHLALAYAASLQMVTGRLYEAPVVAAAILNCLEPRLLQLTKEGFAGDLQHTYRTLCITLGKMVRLLPTNGVESFGEAVDIDIDGALVCMVQGQKQRIVAGDTSVRGIYGYI